MNFHLLFAFFLGMILLAATPGPGVFASMAKAITEGFKKSLFFIGGLVLGDIFFLLLALFGLSFVAKMLGPVFQLIKIVGGIYLIYLGIHIFRSLRTQADLKDAGGENKIQQIVSGLFLTLGNPKPILFYASVLPTIINFSEVRFLDALLMMVLIALVSFSVLGTYCYIACVSNKLTMSEKFQKRIHRTAGVSMITVGLYVTFL